MGDSKKEGYNLTRLELVFGGGKFEVLKFSLEVLHLRSQLASALDL